MYTLYSGVNYKDGNTKNLPDIDCETISDVALAMAKVMSNQDDLGPSTFTFSVTVEEK